ncbi:hypothetical protein J4433_00750 [Candidatus Pacearchaeota archaeon]|nr:hypothetical protein [Candidatus Pacearchaeota archaeon]
MNQFKTNYRFFEARAKKLEEAIVNMQKETHIVFEILVESSREKAQKGDIEYAHNLLNNLAVYVK